MILKMKYRYTMRHMFSNFHLFLKNADWYEGELKPTI